MKPEPSQIRKDNSAPPDKNVMPSMVVRQQRIQLNSGPGPNVPPPPTANLMKAAAELAQMPLHQQTFDANGLVLPKRVLPGHPMAGAHPAQPIIRDLNRELKFNQLHEKNVLGGKSELRRAMERLEESKKRREAEQERLSRRTSLELRLEERADRLARQQQQPAPAPAPASPPQQKESKPSANGFGVR